jgi:hypothetical protein
MFSSGDQDAFSNDEFLMKCKGDLLFLLQYNALSLSLIINIPLK